MSKLITSRVSIALVAAVFAAATWFNSSFETSATTSTNMGLLHAEQEANSIAANTGFPRL